MKILVLILLLVGTMTSFAKEKKIIRMPDQVTGDINMKKLSGVFPTDKPGKIVCQISADHGKNKWESKVIYLNAVKVKGEYPRQDIEEKLGPYTFNLIVMNGGLMLQIHRTSEKRFFATTMYPITSSIIGKSVMVNPSLMMESYDDRGDIDCSSFGYSGNPYEQ